MDPAQYTARSRTLLQGKPTPIRTTAEKVAHAEAVKRMQPEMLLKNLKVKEQLSTGFIPGPCERGEGSVNTTCGAPRAPPWPPQFPFLRAALQAVKIFALKQGKPRSLCQFARVAQGRVWNLAVPDLMRHTSDEGVPLA